MCSFYSTVIAGLNRNNTGEEVLFDLLQQLNVDKSTFHGLRCMEHLETAEFCPFSFCYCFERVAGSAGEALDLLSALDWVHDLNLGPVDFELTLKVSG
ncbi:hypothetical protein L195_g041955 [Trifolium pratense]|uniref:Uncharacterized protein n=1 Tax=Trifolium pratense TaxID=57577 RepID=A0A2K3M515_TRIPR|nr:hypothetical protein L195_g041955 [Trifolium pratense]